MLFILVNMGTLWRTLDARRIRDIAAISLAVTLVGISFGAIAVASGLPPWAVLTMSVVVFAGGSQFMAVGMLAAGSPLAAILAGLLLNARHLPFGLAIADVLAGSRIRRLVGAHLMVDEAVAFTMAETEPGRRRAAYWLTGVLLFTGWQVGTLGGVVLGGIVGDPATYGLDAAFPAALIALLLPSLRQPEPRRVALVAAAVAVGASFVLPPGLPILLALLALVTVNRRPALVAS